MITVVGNSSWQQCNGFNVYMTSNNQCKGFNIYMTSKENIKKLILKNAELLIKKVYTVEKVRF